MARTVPVHSGYTIINGTGTGSNWDRIDVWVEYKVASQSTEDNQSRVIAYFYTALRSGESSGTWSSDDGYSSFSVNGVSGTGLWNDHAYDFRVTTPMLLGSFDRDITHNQDGTKTVAVAGSFSTASSYISGGHISANVTLPTIERGMFRVKMGGVWRTATTYVRVSGTWRWAQVFVKAGGSWRYGI
jgi:hypothetical protein